MRFRTGALGAALLATGCAAPSGPPHALLLQVRGDGTLDGVAYTVDGDRTDEAGPVSLPWERVVSVAADGEPHPWTLRVRLGPETGQLTMYSTLDGKGSLPTAIGAPARGTRQAAVEMGIDGTVAG